MKEKVLCFDFFKEYYDAVKKLPFESIGKIMLVLMSKLFDGIEAEVPETTAEEEAIILLLEDLVDLHDTFSSTWE